MKRVSLALLCFLVVFTHTMFSQTPDFLPAGLHKLTPNEMMNTRISLDLPVYSPEGKKLDQLEGMKSISSPEYKMEVYGNSKGEAKAILLIKNSEEETARKLEAMMARNMGTEHEASPAKNFKVTDMDGERLILSDLKGSVVVLNFWFIGCKPCLVEIPELNSLVEKYKEQNIKFIAFAIDPKSSLSSFLEKTEFKYQVIPDARATASDYEIMGYPTHILIDTDGKVAFYQRGYNGALSYILDRRIEELLKN